MAGEPDEIGQYLERAAELRALAHSMTNADAKALLLRVADDYEQMALSLRKRAGEGR